MPKSSPNGEFRIFRDLYSDTLAVENGDPFSGFLIIFLPRQGATSADSESIATAALPVASTTMASHGQGFRSSEAKTVLHRLHRVPVLYEGSEVCLCHRHQYH